MAVHLNARLKTRFIPFLFTAAFLVSAAAAIARASSDGALADALSDSQEDEASFALSRQELQSVMSEGLYPNRLDRRPGFSPIIVAPRPGEHPTTGSLTAQKEEEPPPVVGAGSSNFLDFSDELPSQPLEADAQR